MRVLCLFASVFVLASSIAVHAEDRKFPYEAIIDAEDGEIEQPQTTSLVNCIATMGSSRMNAAVPHTATRQRLPRHPLAFSVFSAIALSPSMSKAPRLHCSG